MSSAFRPAIFICLLLTSSFLIAQDSATGSLRGTVLDPTGGRVSQASIVVVNSANNARFTAMSNSQGEFALEGLDAPMPQGRFKMERFALKAISPTNLMRWAALYSDPLRRPAPDKALGLFAVLAGAEVKGISMPFKATDQLVTIDTLSLDWGQLVGSIPSKASLVAKHNCRTVRFSVYIKDGKAALKATPIRE